MPQHGGEGGLHRWDDVVGIRPTRSSASSPRATDCWPVGWGLDEVCRRLEITESSWHGWVAQYGGVKVEEAAGRGRAGQGDAQGDRGGKLLTANRRRRAVAMCASGSGSPSVEPAGWPASIARPSGSSRRHLTTNTPASAPPSSWKS